MTTSFIQCPKCAEPVEMRPGPILATHWQGCQACNTDFKFKTRANSLEAMITVDEDENIHFVPEQGEYTHIIERTQGE